jgi:PAS domain S-box-containing protein
MSVEPTQDDDPGGEGRTDALRHAVEVARREASDLRALIRELGVVAVPDVAARSEAIQSMLDRAARAISELTDFQTASVVLFSYYPPFRSAFLALSPNVSVAQVEQLGDAVHSPDQRRRLADTLRGGQVISAGELGECVYFPATRTSVVRQLEAVIKTEDALPETTAPGRWSRYDELVVPIAANDGTYLGFISVDDPRSGLAPDSKSVLPVVAFARRIAVAVEHAEIGQEAYRSEDRARESAAQLAEANVRLRESAYEAEALYRASKLLLDVSDLDRLYVQIVEAVRAEFGFTDCAFIPTKGDGDAHGAVPTRRDAGGIATRLDSPRSELAVPLIVDGTVAGTLVLESPRAGAFTALDERILASFAERAALAIRQARLHREIRDSLQREAIIRRITSTIRESLDLESVFQSTVDLIGRELNVDRCVLYRIEGSEMVQVAQYTGHDVPRIDSRFDTTTFSDLYQLAIDQGEMVFDDVTSDIRLPTHLVESYLAPIGTRGLLFFPIVVGDEIRAVLVLVSVGGPRRWTSHDIAVARGVAEQVGMAIHQARLFELVSRGKIEWEATFDALADAILLFGPDGSLLRCNMAAIEALSSDVEPEGILRCCDLFGSESSDSCIVERAVQARERTILEATIRRFGGPSFVVVDPLSEASGTGVGAICVVRDLSLLREAETEARHQRAILATLVENTSDALVAVDLEGCITWVNPRAAELLGRQAKDLTSERLVELVPQFDHGPFRAIFSDVESAAPISFEGMVRSAKGDERSVAVTGARVYLDGRLRGVLLVVRDVTDERRAAARAAHADKLRALGRLASGVAHDFNNVLATILGNAQLLRRQSRDEEATRRLSDIEDAALDGAATVRRIQEFARARGDEDYEIVDVMSLVEGAIEFTRARWENDARARGIEYEVYATVVGDRPTVMGDPSDLREVFVNIMFNAFDAMPVGGTLRISCLASEVEAIVRFADTGQGIRPENLAQIFEPFFTTKGTFGAGLGLAVAYGVVSRHGGRIEAHSDGIHGSSFAVVLPLAGSPTESETSDPPHATPLSVLVIDDDEPVQRVLAELLRAQGHNVEVASTGPEGLAVLASGGVDAVFTDLSMPGMDGWEVARRVRADYPGTKVVLITGFGAAIDPSESHKHVDAVVSKPFLYSTLAKVLRDLSAPSKA